MLQKGLFASKYLQDKNGQIIKVVNYMVNVAVLGFGVVGSGVVELISENAEIISHKAGDEVQVKYILDVRDFLIASSEINLLRISV